MFITDCLVCEGTSKWLISQIYWFDYWPWRMSSFSVITFLFYIHQIPKIFIHGLNETLNPIFGLRHLHPLNKMNNHDLKTHLKTVPSLLGKLRTPKKPEPSFCKHMQTYPPAHIVILPEISLNILILCSTFPHKYSLIQRKSA